MEGVGYLPSKIVCGSLKSVTFAAASAHVKQLKYDASKEDVQHSLGEHDWGYRMRRRK